MITLFQTKSTCEIKDYMDMHFKYWAKIYNLKNLCIILDDSMVRLAKKKKTWSLKIKVSHNGKHFFINNNYKFTSLFIGIYKLYKNREKNKNHSIFTTCKFEWFLYIINNKV